MSLISGKKQLYYTTLLWLNAITNREMCCMGIACYVILSRLVGLYQPQFVDYMREMENTALM
jgi:hypothetical protein